MAELVQTVDWIKKRKSTLNFEKYINGKILQFLRGGGRMIAKMLTNIKKGLPIA
jgi:hypothetical protein